METEGASRVERIDVIKQIVDSIGLGRGVIPLIGSGMSAASGIPSGDDYRAYLFFCLMRAFSGSKQPSDASTPAESFETPWDPRVIDSFFVDLTEGKTPNAAHAILAHLADTLRLEIILTTNFDNLIESAFRELDMPVATFDVHYDAGLPDVRLMRTQRSIVKLHGGRYGLRADFSLDTSPQQADMVTFCAYLGARKGDADKAMAQPRRDLLVMAHPVETAAPSP